MTKVLASPKRGFSGLSCQILLLAVFFCFFGTKAYACTYSPNYFLNFLQTFSYILLPSFLFLASLYQLFRERRAGNKLSLALIRKFAPRFILAGVLFLPPFISSNFNPFYNSCSDLSSFEPYPVQSMILDDDVHVVPK